VARRLVLLVALVGAFLVVSAPGAHACSCAEGDPLSALAGADAAFLGWSLGNAVFPGFGSSVRYEVDWVLKGDLPPIVIVAGVGPGSSCGLGAGFGQHVGLLLSGSFGRWRANLCSEFDADRFLSGAGPLASHGQLPGGLRMHRPSPLAIGNHVVVWPRGLSVVGLGLALASAARWWLALRRGPAQPPRSPSG
jgi:hypothetical protein